MYYFKPRASRTHCIETYLQTTEMWLNLTPAPKLGGFQVRSSTVAGVGSKLVCLNQVFGALWSGRSHWLVVSNILLVASTELFFYNLLHFDHMFIFFHHISTYHFHPRTLRSHTGLVSWFGALPSLAVTEGFEDGLNRVF